MGPPTRGGLLGSVTCVRGCGVIIHCGGAICGWRYFYADSTGLDRWCQRVVSQRDERRASDRSHHVTGNI